MPQVPLFGIPYSFTVSLFDAATPGRIKTTPTLTAGDFQLSQDNGPLAALATLPAETPAGSGRVLVSLSAAEMRASKLSIRFIDPEFEWGDGHVFLDLLPPLAGTAYSFNVALFDTANAGKLLLNPVITGTEFQVVIGNAAPVPLTFTPVESPVGSGIVRVQLAAAEMPADVGLDSIVTFSDPAFAWGDGLYVVSVPGPVVLPDVTDVPLTWGDISDLLEMRARRLGILDDAAELLLSAYNMLQALLDTYDLSAYIVTRPTIWTTSVGLREYALPSDFGRPLHVRVQLQPAGGIPGTGDSGFFLGDGGSSHTRQPLPFVDTILFQRTLASINNRPQRMTRSGRSIVLDPAPDANNGLNYTIGGSYIARLSRPDLDQVVLLDEPMLLVASTLAQMAGDRGLPQYATVANEAKTLLSAAVNNQARQNQQFYTQQFSWRSRRR